MRVLARIRPFILNLLLVGGSSLFTLLLVESAARIYTGRFTFENYREEFYNLFTSATPAQYDSQLGWIPRPSTFRNETIWGTRVTILADSTRSNGDHAAPRETGRSPILAVGDSFTYGDGVSDHETWPASLETLLGRRVINGGVFNFGVDQSFLRAKALIKRYHPEILIFSFISDDVRRATLSVRTGVGKPYFDVSGGTLQLKNVPVPQMSQRTPEHTGLQRLLGYSYLAHTVLMNHRFSAWYLRGIWSENEVRAIKDGERVACLIFDELKRMVEDDGIRVVLLAQYGRWETDETVQVVQRVLQCTDHGAFTVVDLRPSLEEVRARSQKEYESYYKGHMSFEGNAFVARQLSAAIPAAHGDLRMRAPRRLSGDDARLDLSTVPERR